MLDVPQYLGVQTLDASGIVLRFWVKVAEKNIYAGARALNRELLLGFRRLGGVPLPSDGRTHEISHGREEQGVHPGAGARRPSTGVRCPPAGGPIAGHRPSRRGLRRGKCRRAEKEDRQVEKDRHYAGGLSAMTAVAVTGGGTAEDPVPATPDTPPVQQEPYVPPEPEPEPP